MKTLVVIAGFPLIFYPIFDLDHGDHNNYEEIDYSPQTLILPDICLKSKTLN